MTSDEQLGVSSDHERAVQIISSYIDSWLNATLADCVGNEQRRLLAVLRTTETYLLCLCGMITLPNANYDKCKSILHGAELIIPALLKKIPNPKRNINRTMTNEASLEWAAGKLENAGQLLSLKRLAQGGYGGVSQSIVHNEEDISIYLTSHAGEQTENLDRNAVNDRKREGEKEILEQRFRKLVDLAAARTLSAIAATSAQMIVSDANDDFFKTVTELFDLNSREYIESESLPDVSLIGPLLFSEWKTIAVHVAAQIEINFLRVFKATRQYRFPVSVNLNIFPKLLSRTETEALFLSSCSAVNASNLNEVIEVFTLTLASSSLFINKTVELPFPMLIEVGSDYFFVYTGAHGNPYWFMVEMLKIKFQKNYDQNLKLLEKIFENEFHNLFCSSVYSRGKGEVDLLKADGKFLTDIDASVYESTTNTLYIVQLYWPAAVAREMKARSSQITNLRRKSKWIDDVNSWLTRMGSNSREDILRKLDLLRLNIDTKTLNIQYMVISRGWTRFAGQEPYGKGAVWVSWTKLQEVLHRHAAAEAPLAAAYAELDDIAWIEEKVTNIEPITYRFADLTIRLQAGEI